MGESTAWWESFFDATYADVCLARIDPATTAATAAFLTRHLALGPGARALDQCCGTGRLALALAREGVEVVGVDRNPEYVDAARDAARDLPASFVAADATRFVPDRPVDAAFNWFTSLGYADEAFDAALIGRAVEALRPGGRLALETFNLVRVLRDGGRIGLRERIRRRLRRRHRHSHERYPNERYPHERSGEAISIEATHVDFLRGTLVGTWRVGGERRTTRLRMTLPHQLVGLLEAAGLERPRLYGSLDAEPFTADSPRCILVARKPG